MEKESSSQTKRYLMIELSCDQKACSPCTYPNCQRYARHLPKNKKLFESVKSKATKDSEVVSKVGEAPADETNKHSHAVSRYILTELSCSEAKCSPCTYPNCQRYARSNKKVKSPKGSPVVNVTELKMGKGLKKLYVVDSTIEGPDKT
jgi:hypothetical protein